MVRENENEKISSFLRPLYFLSPAVLVFPSRFFKKLLSLPNFLEILFPLQKKGVGGGYKTMCINLKIYVIIFDPFLSVLGGAI